MTKKPKNNPLNGNNLTPYEILECAWPIFLVALLVVSFIFSAAVSYSA